MAVVDFSLHLAARLAAGGAPVYRACQEVFGGSADEQHGFFMAVLRQPIIFTGDQLAFWRALHRCGAFAGGPSPTHAQHAPAVHYVGVAYERTGQVRYSLDAMIAGLSRLMVDPTMTPTPRFTSLASVPGRIAHAMLFHRGTAPLRAWMFSRFFAPTCEDATVWLSSRYAFFQTPEFIDLAYMESAFREANPQFLAAAAHREHRVVAAHDQYAIFDTQTGPVQRTMEHSPRRMIVAFYSYFMQRVMLAACDNPLVGLARRVTDAQRLFELALSMLMGWSVNDSLPLVASLPHTTVALLDDVAEQFRTFIAAAADGGGAPLVRATYSRTADFDRVYLPHAQVREMLISRGEDTRRIIEPFYVPLAERSFSTLVRSLFVTHQVAQVRRLDDWFRRCAHTTAPIEIDTLMQSPEYAASADARYYAASLAGGVHFHRVAWSLRYYEEAARPLLDGLCDAAHIGLDAENLPFMVLPREMMSLLRLVMMADAFTTRNHHKTTAVYPLLMRMYVTRQRDDAPLIDAVSLHTFGAILAYWLCVPVVPGGGVFARLGMSELTDASLGMLRCTHHVVNTLYRARGLNDATTVPLEIMNAVRSFLMIRLPHHMTRETYTRLTRALARVDAVEWPQFVELYEALMALPVGGVASRTWRRLGTLEAPRGRPKEFSSLAERVCTALVNHSDASARLPHGHTMEAVHGESRMVLLNMLLYEFLLTAPSAGLLTLEEAADALVDFAALTDPLTDRNYRRSHYHCSPDVVSTWQQSNMFFRNLGALRYAHNTHVLRDEHAGNNGDAIASMVTFLQHLERHICVADAMCGASSTARTRARGLLAAGESALLDTLRALYADPDALLGKMPVSTFYRGADHSHHVAFFEESMCVVDLMPSSEAAGVVNPNRVVYDATAAPELSHVAIDLATQFDAASREVEVSAASLRHRVFNEIRQYASIQKMQK